MKNLVAGVVLGAAMFTAGAVFTAETDDDVLREARDSQQIDEVMWRYARALAREMPTVHTRPMGNSARARTQTRDATR